MTGPWRRSAAALLAATVAMAGGRVSAAPEEAAVEEQPESDAESDDAESDDASEVESAKTPVEPTPVVAPVEPAPQPIGTRIIFSGGAPGELELFRVDPNAGANAVGKIDGIPYSRVCTDPCELRVRLHPDDQLFVAGRKLIPSKRFTVDHHARQIRLQTRPGPKPIRFAGFGLTVSGSILIPAGILLVGAVDRGPKPEIAGFTLIGIGVLSLAIGIGLLIRGRTLVQVDEAR